MEAGVRRGARSKTPPPCAGLFLLLLLITGLTSLLGYLEVIRNPGACHLACKDLSDARMVSHK